MKRMSMLLPSLALLLASCTGGLSGSSSGTASNTSVSEAGAESDVSETATIEDGSSTNENESYGPEESQEPYSGKVYPNGAMIVLDDQTTSNTSAIATLEGRYSIEGAELSQAVCTKLYGTKDDEGIRVGSSQVIGSLSLTFSKEYAITGVTLLAKSYSEEKGVVAIVGAGDTETEIDVPSEKGYCATSSFYAETDTITISNFEKGKRFCLYQIHVDLAEIVPVYPSSISLSPSSFELAKGRKQALTVTYSPFNTNIKDCTFSSNNSTVATVDSNGAVTAIGEGSTTITAQAASANGYVSATAQVTVVASVPGSEERTVIEQTYVDYADYNAYDIDSCPTSGTIHPLVIPVWFTDSSTYIKSSTNKSNVRSDIEAAYFGTEEETGWHSVKSFYEEESSGKLTIEGVVSDWYECGKSSSNYYYDTSTKTTSLVESAVSWYFNQDGVEPKSYFDADSDGYLDAVLLIYGAPDYYTMNKSSATNLWAYCYWIQDTALENTANPGPNTFFWASYDFMYDSTKAYSRAGSSYGCGDCSHCEIDAHTFIHEMGHVFGLDDYYDYGNYGYSFAGGFSMQDLNVGGHDPFSTLALGWSDPYIPTESTTIELRPFQNEREVILLTPEWNEFNSPFDEYLLLELYTPTGLNELDCTYPYDAYPQGPNATGIRLWHVDARLLFYNSETASAKNLTSDCHYSCTHGVETAFTNSYGNTYYGSPLGNNYDKYKLLQLIRNDTSASLLNRKDISSADLFGDGSSFDLSSYSSQFVKPTTLNSGKELGWSFSVSISGSGETAVASIELIRD